MAKPASRSRRRQRHIVYYNDDGLMELCLGAAFLLAGLTVMQASPAAPLWLLVAGVAILLLKKVITEPRLEASKIDPAVVRRAAADTPYSTTRAVTTAVTLAVVVIVFVVYEILDGSKSDLSSDFWQQPMFLVVVVVGACFGAGAQYQAPRLFVYGALATILGVITFFSDLSFEAVVIITGLVMVLTGGFVLVRFLQSHPRPGSG